jgi:O-antigen/teichoic acid export membrane protein
VVGLRRFIHNRIGSILRDGLHRQAAVGAAWNLVGTVVSRLVTLLATVAVIRVLGPSGFGSLVLIQTTAATIATLSGLGLAFATTRFVAEQLNIDKRKAGHYLNTSVTLCMISGSIVGLAVLAFSSQLATDILGRSSLAPAMAIAAPLLLFSPLADVLIGGITGLQKFKALGWAQGARGILDGVFLVIGAHINGVEGGVEGFVAAEVIACLIAGAIVHGAARSNAIELKPRLDRSVLPSLVRFALPSLTTALLFAGSLWLGQIFLAHQPGGLKSVGIFVFAQRFYLAALFLPTVIGTVLFPMFTSLVATRQFSRFRRLLRGYLGFTMFLTALVSGVLFLLARFVTSLGGDGRLLEVHTLDILALVAIPTALNNALGQAAVALRRIGWWVFSDVVLAIVLLGVAKLLVPSHGSVGLALAYLAGYGATCVAIMPAFLNIPRDKPGHEPAFGTIAENVNFNAVLPTEGVSDTLPPFPTVIRERTTGHEVDPPTVGS